MLNVTRRAFIGIAGAILGGGITPFALTRPRQPFVVEGEHVDSLIFHLWDTPHAPTGPLSVHEILPWDGRGYPIVLRQWNYGNNVLLFDGWYDFEWSNLLRDVPERFWQQAAHREKYPNVHSYVREQRFGEPPSVMAARMKANRLSYGSGPIRPPCPPGRPLQVAA